MRLRPFLLAASIALFACSSEEPKTGESDVVENVPGALVITSPSRASFIESKGGPVVVRGTGATKALTIDGNAVNVSADGSFEATIDAKPGLNLIEAVDGESKLEVPFLYGEFLPANQPVSHAIAIDIGALGLAAPAPAASLTSIVNLALEGRDLIAAMRGKSFSGNVLGGSWSFQLTGGSHAKATASLASADKGPLVSASARDLVIEGTMAFGSLTRAVRITSTEAKISGVAELSVKDGVLGAAMPDADIDLPGFRIDSGNGTIDQVVSLVVRPIIESVLADAIKDQIPNMVKLTLDGIGLPKELDLSAMGLQAKVPLATKFDAAAFDPSGGTITIATLFGGAPAENAPGWLKLGGAFSPGMGRAPAFGASFSIDTVNQLLFAAWATKSLSFGAQGMRLAPALPPLVAIDNTGTLEVGFGEVLVQREGSDTAMCAVTARQKIDLAADGDALVLAPKGEPKLSITWLSGQRNALLEAIVEAAKGQVTKILKPVRIPMPKMGLSKLGASFADQSLAITDARITVDRTRGRVAAAGAMSLVK
jgi:hypothetical protein